MDRFLEVIVAGDISPRTKETLLKQLNEQITLPAPQKVADQEVAEMPAGPPDGPRQAAPRPGPQAAITDPVTKIVGLDPRIT